MTADSIVRVSPATIADRPRQSVGPGDTPTAEELRQVAEEVRLAFPRPLRAPQLVLIDVDPHHLHAFWTLEPAAVDAARRAPDGDGEMVLRIAEAGEGHEAVAFDVEVIGLQGQCYVDVWGEQRCYRGEIGLRGLDGRLTPLAPAAAVQLPRTASGIRAPAPPPAPPADQAAETPEADVVAPAEPVPAALELPEPARHPFPLPPTEAGVYDPEPGAPVLVIPPAEPAAAPAAAARPMPAAHELPEPVRHPFPLPPTEAGTYDPEPRAPALAMSPAEPAPPPPAVRPVPAAHELPEPVRHPFPLPPTEASEYIPEGLLGGFAPADTPLSAEPATAETPPDFSAEAASTADAPPPAGQTPASGQAGAVPAPEAADPAGLLPLENVLTLSSFALGRESVEFEINAELHISGRVRPGMRLQLFGRPVALRPDGSFSITRPLPAGALLFSSLLISDDSTP